MSKKVSSIVTEYILGEIRKGTFKVGDKLHSERELMETLKVGRSSVREALNSLVDMQVLEKRMGIGVFVKKTDFSDMVHKHVVSALLDPKSSRELMEFRLMLEVEICGKAAEVAKEEDFVQMEQSLEMMKRAIQMNLPILEADQRFHQAIVHATRNQVLMKVYESITDFLTSAKREMLLISDKLTTIQFHEKIYRAIKDHNVELSRQMMREHLYDVAIRYEKLHEKWEREEQQREKTEQQ
ncbi:FadR/GntR family transcriptional regulator [Neobacillus sp. KR4-4]|uniref:FadR/GntR family transcriptional regulator n=1 Tax=Neobacillus sp. KR4-4 TaxID=3344872 RepID=UPI0035CA3FAE